MYPPGGTDKIVASPAQEIPWLPNVSDVGTIFVCFNVLIGAPQTSIPGFLPDKQRILNSTEC